MAIPSSFWLVSSPFHCPLPHLTRPSHRPLLHIHLSTVSSSSSSASHHRPSTFQYGPSLLRGQPPSSPFAPASEDNSNNDSSGIVREAFSRTFNLSALRVPTDQCHALESRLRGHLLNWPRIRNIARTPGDDVDPEIGVLLRDGPDGDRLRLLAHQSLEREDLQPLSPVLYRDKLTKEFNWRGFLKFRNLARMSRPKKKNKTGGRSSCDKEEEGGVGGNDRVRKRAYALVEVTEDYNDKDSLGGLLGDDIRGGWWRGSFRLLLLDERYSEKDVEEFPEAVKAILRGDARASMPVVPELVKCQMTLFYDYWPMNEILEAFLPEGMVIPSSFETVGHIAHLNLKEDHLPYKKIIAQVILDKNKPKIQTVVNKVDAIQNEYRTMPLEVLAGNHSLVTTIIENGIKFHLDLATVYWNSRLATERQRLLCSFSSNDVVCDVFAGVGPIAISAAKKVKYVYANDLNPHAVEYLERNIVLNKLDRKIEVCNMDGRRFISSIFARQKHHLITQVVMNLPNDAVEFLDSFRGVFSRVPKRGSFSMPKIHIYGFSKAQDPEFDFHERIKMALFESRVDIETHRVRLVAPGKWMLCASFILPEKMASTMRAS